MFKPRHKRVVMWSIKMPGQPKAQRIYADCLATCCVLGWIPYPLCLRTRCVTGKLHSHLRKSALSVDQSCGCCRLRRTIKSSEDMGVMLVDSRRDFTLNHMSFQRLVWLPLGSPHFRLQPVSWHRARHCLPNFSHPLRL